MGTDDIGLGHFLATICVTLHAPREVIDQAETKTLTGYYMTLGITATSAEAAKGLISEEIDDGDIDWEESELNDRELSTLDRDISKHCDDASREGVWYRTGRAMF
jgi:hypothetical protein